MPYFFCKIKEKRKKKLKEKERKRTLAFFRCWILLSMWGK
jgi:hypothetical protein